MLFTLTSWILQQNTLILIWGHMLHFPWKYDMLLWHRQEMDKIWYAMLFKWFLKKKQLSFKLWSSFTFRCCSWHFDDFDHCGWSLVSQSFSFFSPVGESSLKAALFFLFSPSTCDIIPVLSCSSFVQLLHLLLQHGRTQLQRQPFKANSSQAFNFKCSCFALPHFHL